MRAACRDDPDGPRNILKHGVNGLVIDPYDVDALANAISTLANSPELKDPNGAPGSEGRSGLHDR